MARSRTLETQQQNEQSAMPIATDDTGFGAEYRELARQRRFVRSSTDRDPAALESAFWARTEEPVKPVATPATPGAPLAAPIAAAIPAPAPIEPTVAPVAATPAPMPAPAAPRVRAPRISEDQRATLLELARMSDRLVQSREDLAAATSRADRLETELTSARGGLAAANDRLMASRVIVLDAQRATRELAERAAWLEGRVETLQEALELAVNASVVTRWKWRREQRARTRAQA